jgi:hypothetical protein
MILRLREQARSHRFFGVRKSIFVEILSFGYEVFDFILFKSRFLSAIKASLSIAPGDDS